MAFVSEPSSSSPGSLQSASDPARVMKGGPLEPPRLEGVPLGRGANNFSSVPTFDSPPSKPMDPAMESVGSRISGITALPNSSFSSHPGLAAGSSATSLLAANNAMPEPSMGDYVTMGCLLSNYDSGLQELKSTFHEILKGNGITPGKGANYDEVEDSRACFTVLALSLQTFFDRLAPSGEALARLAKSFQNPTSKPLQRRMPSTKFGVSANATWRSGNNLLSGQLGSTNTTTSLLDFTTTSNINNNTKYGLEDTSTPDRGRSTTASPTHHAKTSPNSPVLPLQNAEDHSPSITEYKFGASSGSIYNSKSPSSATFSATDLGIIGQNLERRASGPSHVNFPSTVVLSQQNSLEPSQFETRSEVTISGQYSPSPSELTTTGRLGHTLWNSCASLAPEAVKPIKVTDNVKFEVNAMGNDIINGYEVIDRIGRGAFAKVMLAVREEDDTTVAIKVMEKSLLRKAKQCGGVTAWEQVQAEIAIMKKMRHKNVVQLFEVIDDPLSNKLYLIMQYCQHGALMKVDDTLGTCKPMPEAKVKDVLRQLVSGLHYLHRHNIIHRDIKPENILLDAEDTVYLTDFGVSEMFSAETEDAALHTQQGTPPFFSPELCRGEGGVHGKAVDVWALGVTIYCLLFGKLPFWGGNIRQVMSIIQNNTLELPPECDDTWADLLKGMLNKDPKARISLPEIRHHAVLTGQKVVLAASASTSGSGTAQSDEKRSPSKYVGRIRRMTEYDIITVEQEDLDSAIAIAGSKTKLKEPPRKTPRQKVSRYADGVRQRVRRSTIAWGGTPRSGDNTFVGSGSGPDSPSYPLQPNPPVAGGPRVKWGESDITNEQSANSLSKTLPDSGSFALGTSSSTGSPSPETRAETEVFCKTA